MEKISTSTNRKSTSIRLTSYFDGDRSISTLLTIVMRPVRKFVLDGWISLNKNYHLRLASEGISLKNITQLQLGEVDNGKVSFDFQGKGDFENPQLKGKVALNDLRFNDQHLQDVQFQIEVKDQTAHISGGPNFALDAIYHFQTQAFFSIRRV